jgi:hypothetical protein
MWAGELTVEKNVRVEELIASIKENVIGPAEAKEKVLRQK